MIVILGALIVAASVAGGFIMGGGHLGALIQFAEFVVICGAASGALVIMSPKKVLTDLIKNSLHTLRGTPYSKKAYTELFRVLYEMFNVGRRNGMIALEDHVASPESSTIFSKYPGFLNNRHA